MPNCPDTLMRELAEHCLGLHSLKLRVSPALSDDGLLYLASGRLTQVDLGRCDALTDASLCTFVQRNPHLSVLDISWTQVTDRFCDTLAEACPLLVNLVMEGCKVVTEDGFLTIARGCHMISRYAVCTRDMGLQQTRHCIALMLIVLCMFMTNGFFRVFCSCVFSWNSRITDEGVAQVVRALPRLRECVLTSCLRVSHSFLSDLCESHPHLVISR